jgi:hypothetical protein
MTDRELRDLWLKTRFGAVRGSVNDLNISKPSRRRSPYHAANL